MDRVPVFGTGDEGSIPPRGTKFLRSTKFVIFKHDKFMFEKIERRRLTSRVGRRQVSTISGGRCEIFQKKNTCDRKCTHDSP